MHRKTLLPHYICVMMWLNTLIVEEIKQKPKNKLNILDLEKKYIYCMSILSWNWDKMFILSSNNHNKLNYAIKIICQLLFEIYTYY